MRVAEAHRGHLPWQATVRRSRFTEEQFIRIPREAEAGIRAAELVRKQGISEQTLYRWKAKYRGLSVNESRQLGADGRARRSAASLSTIGLARALSPIFAVDDPTGSAGHREMSYYSQC